MAWKKGILQTLVCSNDNLFQQELHHIETCFTELNDYPKWLLRQTLDSFENNDKNHNNNISNENHNDANLNMLSDKILHILKLPYKDNHGINLTKSIKISMKKSLSNKHDVRIILIAKKLSSHRNIKDDTNK